MTNFAEEKVSEFYKGKGWEESNGITEDAKRWEDTREYAREYVSKCRMRVMRFVPKTGNAFLDMGSGPIQYPEYLIFSEQYAKRYCIDLSPQALESAKLKLGDRGEYMLGSIFDLDLKPDFFDCTISQHVIYHIAADRQEDAVRKLIRSTKPGHPIIIVYANPFTVFQAAALPIRLLKALKSLFNGKERKDLYYYCHHFSWWQRFQDVATLNYYPWRTMAATYQKCIIPNNSFGKWILKKLYALEEKFPLFFSKHFQYYIVIINKKSISSR